MAAIEANRGPMEFDDPDVEIGRLNSSLGEANRTNRKLESQLRTARQLFDSVADGRLDFKQTLLDLNTAQGVIVEQQEEIIRAQSSEQAALELAGELETSLTQTKGELEQTKGDLVRSRREVADLNRINGELWLSELTARRERGQALERVELAEGQLLGFFTEVDEFREALDREVATNAQLAPEAAKVPGLEGRVTVLEGELAATQEALDSRNQAITEQPEYLAVMAELRRLQGVDTENQSLRAENATLASDNRRLRSINGQILVETGRVGVGKIIRQIARIPGTNLIFSGISQSRFPRRTQN